MLLGLHQYAGLHLLRGYFISYNLIESHIISYHLISHIISHLVRYHFISVHLNALWDFINMHDFIFKGLFHLIAIDMGPSQLELSWCDFSSARW